MTRSTTTSGSQRWSPATTAAVSTSRAKNGTTRKFAGQGSMRISLPRVHPSMVIATVTVSARSASAQPSRGRTGEPDHGDVDGDDGERHARRTSQKPYGNGEEIEQQGPRVVELACRGACSEQRVVCGENVPSAELEQCSFVDQLHPSCQTRERPPRRSAIDVTVATTCHGSRATRRANPVTASIRGATRVTAAHRNDRADASRSGARAKRRGRALSSRLVVGRPSPRVARC